jgi:hypothetical protein
MPTHCHTDTSERVTSAVAFEAQPGLVQVLQTEHPEEVAGDAPQGTQDQPPDEADQDDGEHRRKEQQRAEHRLEAGDLRAEQGGQQQPERVLHQHVDGEEHEVVPDRVPQEGRPVHVARQPLVVAEADEREGPIGQGSEGAEPQRVQQREDHERRVHQRRRRQEHDHVPGEGPT